MASGSSVRRDASSRALWKLGALVSLVVLAGFVVAYCFVDPASPDRIVLATGEAEGVYAHLGERDRDILAELEISVELRTTAGPAGSGTRALASASSVSRASPPPRPLAAFPPGPRGRSSPIADGSSRIPCFIPMPGSGTEIPGRVPLYSAARSGQRRPPVPVRARYDRDCDPID
ncbi:MAG: hypothetical protein CL908_12905 [Deltaproteobacteria bacterium]|nr:hypothetical protein [Deltaproteobacteria bacterium]